MIDEHVRRLVGDHGKLNIEAGRLSADTHLYELGLVSFATQQLPIPEEEFTVETPDGLSRKPGGLLSHKAAA
jgi:hypothetical protein